jgi:tetratricopeptide (TPR) repeat protein
VQLRLRLGFIEHGVTESLRPLLQPLSLHEGYVELDYLETMAKLVPGGWSRAQIHQLANELTAAGLMRHLGQAIYELPPALTEHLRSHYAGAASGPAGSDHWNRAFAHVMAVFADSLMSRPSQDQRHPFSLHAANFSQALAESERLAMEEEEKALTQSLAVWAQSNRNFEEAERLFLRLARHREMAAVAYHELGMIALEQRDFEAAGQRYLKSLEIWETQGNERHAAITCHQLGQVAEARGEVTAAQQWYGKSLASLEKQKDEHGLAMTYHLAITYERLGWLAKQQGDLTAAEQWYRKALAVREK